MQGVQCEFFFSIQILKTRHLPLGIQPSMLKVVRTRGQTIRLRTTGGIEAPHVARFQGYHRRRSQLPLYTPPFLVVPSIISALLSPAPPLVVTLIRGHIAAAPSPPRYERYTPLHFYRDKGSANSAHVDSRLTELCLPTPGALRSWYLARNNDSIQGIELATSPLTVFDVNHYE